MAFTKAGKGYLKLEAILMGCGYILGGTGAQHPVWKSRFTHPNILKDSKTKNFNECIYDVYIARKHKSKTSKQYQEKWTAYEFMCIHNNVCTFISNQWWPWIWLLSHSEGFDAWWHTAHSYDSTTLKQWDNLDTTTKVSGPSRLTPRSMKGIEGICYH